MYATQTGAKPPTFHVLSSANLTPCIFPTSVYLMNQLRSRLGLDMVPIKIMFRKSS